jgi:hypothetical protein
LHATGVITGIDITEHVGTRGKDGRSRNSKNPFQIYKYPAVKEFQRDQRKDENINFYFNCSLAVITN